MTLVRLFGGLLVKIVFMGTPDFAVPALRALAAGPKVAAVVTQPDRSRGRGKKVYPPPVKNAAIELKIPVYQPERVKDGSFISMLREIGPDLVVVVAFGQILPAELLAIPPLGCINVHASLLPRYRGAAPIQRAIMEGERETGVTTMKMDAGLDTGDMLLQSGTVIHDNDNFGTLHDRLAEDGARLLLKTVELLAAGKLAGIPQDHSKSTYAHMIKRDDELIDWNKKAEAIRNQVRGLDPWPGARTGLGGKVLKIWKAELPGRQFVVPGSGEDQLNSVPGQVLGLVDGGLAVQCGDVPLVVREIQLEGGKRMAAADFMRGVRVSAGVVLES